MEEAFLLRVLKSQEWVREGALGVLEGFCSPWRPTKCQSAYLPKSQPPCFIGEPEAHRTEAIPCTPQPVNDMGQNDLVMDVVRKKEVWAWPGRTKRKSGRGQRRKRSGRGQGEGGRGVVRENRSNFVEHGHLSTLTYFHAFRRSRKVF